MQPTCQLFAVVLCSAIVPASCRDRDHASTHRPRILPEPSRTEPTPDDGHGITGDKRHALHCPLRTTPPTDLSNATVDGESASVVWSGREWGVAWLEALSDEPAVYFARVGEDGRRRGSPLRVSERGYRASTPTIAWNGESWNVAFAATASGPEEIWLGRIDARGTAMGRPQRVTARQRRDLAPSLGYDGTNLFLAWTSVMPERRHALYALRMNRWGSQLGPPVRIADRVERLSAPALVANGTGWGVAWLVSRGEAVAVDMGRLDASGLQHGYNARVTIGALGGSDLTARFGVAWNGEQYGLVWDEVRDGAPHVFFDAIDRRLQTRGEPVMLSSLGDAATAPTVVALGLDAFLVAWEVERQGRTRVQLATFDNRGQMLGEPIEAQGPDGEAAVPVLAAAAGAAGLITISSRAVRFHRIELGACMRPPGETPTPRVS